MKIAVSFFVIFVSIVMATSSCQKERWINEEQAADIILRSLEQNSGGLAREADLQTTYWMIYLASIPCGDSVQVTRNFEYNTGGRSAEVDYVWNIIKHCQDPEVFLTWRANFEGTYDFPRVEGSWQGQRNWTATQLGSAFDVWRLQGTEFRSGSHDSKVRRRQSYESTTETTYHEVLIDKSTRRIVGGSATSILTVVSNTGNAHIFNIETTISEVGMATVVVNGTSTFTFNLY